MQAQVLQAHGWTEAMLRIMSSLRAHGQLTVNEVAALSLIEQSGASRMIETLSMPATSFARSQTGIIGSARWP